MIADPGDTKIMTTYNNRGVGFHHRALKQWLDSFHATPVTDKLDSEVRMGIWINSRIRIPVPTLRCVNYFFLFLPIDEFVKVDSTVVAWVDLTIVA